jgi:hypothetical protein
MTNDQSRYTWNGRFGSPTKDQILYQFLRFNAWTEFDDSFHGPAGGWLLKQYSSRKHLTYSDVKRKFEAVDAELGSNNVEILEQFLRAENRASTYCYIVECYVLGNRKPIGPIKYQNNRKRYLENLRKFEWYTNIAPGPSYRM